MLRPAAAAALWSLPCEREVQRGESAASCVAFSAVVWRRSVEPYHVRPYLWT